MSSLTPTGERTVPGGDREQYWFARHEAAYLYVAQRWGRALRDAVVVDAGCGEGYGPDLIAECGTRMVLGLDYDADTCRHARRAYPRVGVVRSLLFPLPVRSGAVDMVVSMQVIEHLWDLPAFLRDCRRCLRPGGLLLATPPNRPVFSPGLTRGARPTNPFHVEEFDAEQVEEHAAAAGFVDLEVHGLHHGPALSAWESQHGPIVDAQVRALTTGDWPAHLVRAVDAVTAADFEVTPRSEGAHDLLLIARAPAR